MKALLMASAIAVGLTGFAAAPADAHPHHRHCVHWVTVWHHHHKTTTCERWGW